MIVACQAAPAGAAMLDLARPAADGARLASVLPPLNVADRLCLRRGADGRARLMPAGGALAIHGLLLALVVRLVVSPLPPPRPEPGFVVVMAQISPLGSAILQAPPAPVARLAPVRALSVHTQPMHQTVLPSGRPMVTSPVKTAAAVAARSGNSAPPGLRSSPVPAPAIDADALLPALEARIDAAVQRAAVLPAAAGRQHRQGRTRLRFTYLDGTVRDVSVVASSLSRILDNAALAAVRDAIIPSAPPKLRGRRLDLLVWINFRLGPDAA